MLFANEWDIDQYQAVFTETSTPNLHAAALTVARLSDWANRNSDGWAYWPKPVRAAARLIQLCEDAMKTHYQGGSLPDISVAELRKAQQPVKAFLTRQNVAHDQVIVSPTSAAKRTEMAITKMDTRMMTVDGVFERVGDDIVTVAYTVEISGYEDDVKITRDTAEYLFEKLGFVLGKEGF